MAKSANIETQLVHLGRTSADDVLAVNPPLVRASTTVFPTLAAFRQSYHGIAFETARYGRSGTNTVFELQTAMAALCHAESCLATGSGLNALIAVLGAHAEPDKQILVQNDVYGPARVYAETELRRFGCRVSFFKDLNQLSDLICDRTTLVLIEVPTSLTMQMLDVRQVCNIAQKFGVPVACDSTWGTPCYFDAHGLGIDISIHAATKYINGHSDVILGLITGSYEKLASTRAWCSLYGTHVAPDAAWLGLRGLRTLDVRMERHQENAFIVAQWLSKHKLVEKVLFPVLSTDAAHLLWRQQFSGGAGPFTIELAECDETSFSRFIDALTLFGLGTSWGGFESLVMPALPHNLRATEVLPDVGRRVRLHIGLENAGDLCDDLDGALSKL